MSGAAPFQPTWNYAQRRMFATKWGEIDAEKYLKEHKTFSERLKHLIQTHDRLNAEKYLDEMKLYGAKPNPAVYQELVRWFAEHDQLPELEKTLNDLIARQVKPSQFMFDRLVHLYAKHQDREGLKRTLKHMESLMMEPNMDTFTEMISAYIKLGDEGSALRTFEHVRRVFGHANSLQCHEIVLMLAKQHDWDNLREIWREFEESNEKPSALLLHTMFDIAFEKMKDMKFARRLMKLMIKYGYEMNHQTFEFVKNV